MLTVLRALAGLVLGLAVFAGLLYFLVVVNFSQRLVEPKVYNIAIEDTDAYNRIYGEVLLDEALKDTKGKLLGYVNFPNPDDTVEVLQQIMPPDYLQKQTEENIGRFTSYLRYEESHLAISISMNEPLNREEAAVLGKVHQIIDKLEIDESASPGCSAAKLENMASTSAASLAQLSDGEIPESATSLGTLTAECRAREFDRWFDQVLDDPAMNSQAALILDGERANLRQQFIAGDTRTFLKAVADPLIKPLIEDAIADIRRNLQRNDRFDVLEWLAQESEDATRSEIEGEAESLREVISAANGPGRYVALAMVVLGCLLMAVVHLPRPAEMLRWPGITLVMGGVVCLIVGFVLNSAIPGQFKDAIVRAASYSPDVPVSVINLAGDLTESFARQATAGFIPASITVIVIGGLLVVASLLSGVLTGVAGKILPSSGDSRRNR